MNNDNRSKTALLPRGQDSSVGAYSPGVRVDDLVFVSGQGPIDFETMKFRLGSIEEETELTLLNVEKVLAEAGCTLADVVKSTVHLRDLQHFSRFNAVYAQRFPKPYPARTTVQSVLGSGISVEIDVIAVRGCGGRRAIAAQDAGPGRPSER